MDETGLTQQHWFVSSVGFTMIIHIIVLKLFLESGYWNWLSAITGVVSLAVYWACVIFLNTDFVALLIQPELCGEYFKIIVSPKAWICMVLVPMVALLPDITYSLMQKVFYPTPTDAVMLKQQRDPNYVYDGFDDVFIPQLPTIEEHIDGFTKVRAQHVSHSVNGIEPEGSQVLDAHSEPEEGEEPLESPGAKSKGKGFVGRSRHEA